MSEEFGPDFITVTDEDGNEIEDAKLVQQKLRIYSDIKVSAGDILRK